ncbi:hypothetical protein [Kitasatospora sp. NPDC002040]|uniref:hypothetical protein n=1 Tax=Kitasatospora sp. NPDC002040 TaxID=3154661 RepID=UPI00331A4FF8
MTDPAHTGSLPAPRTDWTLVHPLLHALAEAGIPLRAGDLEQLQNAAAIGPDFVHALARWIREAHAVPARHTEPALPPAAPLQPLGLPPGRRTDDSTDRQAC